ncbi:hypothetical protein [Nocardioides iriomotensis]|uniref:Uncharacterized protein n=1 Tax=Nocardioides iriomotensis TaxID=715784 RepID=A0A4Q5J5L2_9ACTN|nr:hypothetical protein [Nocardioides iriomotensis]RYU12755.1 hypothetical protein ETU37_07205 [Nocardioides iriomotensis]
MSLTRLAVKAALTLGAGTALAFLGQAAANADGFDSAGSSCGGGSYCVQVTYTGTAAPSGGGGGSVVASVPPICWYEPWMDPDAALKEVREMWNTPHHSGKEYVAGYGSVDRYEEAKKNAPEGSMWYLLKCSVSMSDDRVGEYAGIALKYPDDLGFIPNYTTLVGPGGEPPAPAVDVEVLRDAAYDSMDIPEPEINRNPEVTGSGATLVNLDTMFWADGYADTWDITARVGPVSATVVAEAQDFVLTSPAGGQTCTYEQFTTPYAGGSDTSGGCAFPFTRASLGYDSGFPVLATATWGATWTGTPAPTAPQGLPPVTTSTTVDVPVSESQALVRNVS